MKKTVCLILALILVLALPVCAAASGSSWVLSDDGKFLSGDGVTYEIYPLPPGDRLIPGEIYIYSDVLEHPYQDETMDVGVLGTTGEIVGVSSFFYGGDYGIKTDFVYVTEKGKKILDAYTSGAFAAWYLYSEASGSVAAVDGELIARLDLAAQENQQTVPAANLGLWEAYEILGADLTGSFLHTHGMLFRLPEGDYYVNCDELDNTFFTADGELSFRRGDVPAVKLPGEMAQAVQALMEKAEPISYTVRTYAEEEETYDMDPQSVFAVCSVIMGVILPLIPFVAGIALSFSKKSLHPKRWLALTAFAAVWMALMGIIVYMVL